VGGVPLGGEPEVAHRGATGSGQLPRRHESGGLRGAPRPVQRRPPAAGRSPRRDTGARHPTPDQLRRWLRVRVLPRRALLQPRVGGQAGDPRGHRTEHPTRREAPRPSGHTLAAGSRRYLSGGATAAGADTDARDDAGGRSADDRGAARLHRGHAVRYRRRHVRAAGRPRHGSRLLAPPDRSDEPGGRGRLDRRPPIAAGRRDGRGSATAHRDARDPPRGPSDDRHREGPHRVGRSIRGRPAHDLEPQVRVPGRPVRRDHLRRDHRNPARRGAADSPELAGQSRVRGTGRPRRGAMDAVPSRAPRLLGHASRRRQADPDPPGVVGAGHLSPSLGDRGRPLLRRADRVEPARRRHASDGSPAA